MEAFPRIKRLPPYVFNEVNTLKAEARARGEDIVDFGMGNPDQATPEHIVDKLVETVKRGDTHRYSMSKGITRLRKAMTDWYAKHYDVKLCPESEAIVTIGSKEGLAHLALAMCAPGDTVLVPDPCYPIHVYGFVIAGALVRAVPLGVTQQDFLFQLTQATTDCWPKPKVLVLNFPANPTAQCVDKNFFKAIIDFAKAHNMWVIHDLAYADICFDGYRAPSILEIPGARERAIETYSLSKSYNMPGWRVGFACGNAHLVSALARIKSYLDYGMFTPIQVAAITALEGPQDCVTQICQRYQTRRNLLCDGLNHLGWQVDKPKATMFVWAKIPAPFHEMGSMAFSKMLLKKAGVAVSPGIGFGESGDKYVRFSLIENEQRIRQALRGMKLIFQSGQPANMEISQ